MEYNRIFAEYFPPESKKTIVDFKIKNKNNCLGAYVEELEKAYVKNAETASKRSVLIGDLKNKLIKAQQEVIELRKAYASLNYNLQQTSSEFISSSKRDVPRITLT